MIQVSTITPAKVRKLASSSLVIRGRSPSTRFMAAGEGWHAGDRCAVRRVLRELKSRGLQNRNGKQPLGVTKKRQHRLEQASCEVSAARVFMSYINDFLYSSAKL
jgi:hypothetical protein